MLLAGDTAEDPLGIRLVGPVGGVLLLVGWFSFRRYALYDDVPAVEEPEAASG